MWVENNRLVGGASPSRPTKLSIDKPERFDTMDVLSEKQQQKERKMEYIRNVGGRIIARVNECGDRTELRDAGGRMLGKYLRSTDTTYDEGGRPIGRGNQLLLLVEDR